MAAITVLKNNLPQGPFTRTQVAEKLHAGEFSIDDLAFVEGLAAWTPLRQVLAKVDENLSPVIPGTTSPGVSLPPYSYAATMQPPHHLVYAGFWVRFAAHLIDGLILTVPIFILIIPFALIFTVVNLHASGSSPTSSGINSNPNSPAVALWIIFFEMVFFAVVLGASWLYFSLLESGSAQGTYGKRIMKVRVTSLEGQRIGFGHASGRFFAKIVTNLVPFGIGYIMAGLTEKKQALHDLIASTLVVRD